MSNKLTIVKVMTNDSHPTPADLERWQKIFAEQSMTEEQASATGEVEITHIPAIENEHTITLVKVGDEDYKPTLEDLKVWRDIFEQAAADPDFKIFTHPSVEIDVIKIGKIIEIE